MKCKSSFFLLPKENLQFSSMTNFALAISTFHYPIFDLLIQRKRYRRDVSSTFPFCQRDPVVLVPLQSETHHQIPKHVIRPSVWDRMVLIWTINLKWAIDISDEYCSIGEDPKPIPAPKWDNTKPGFVWAVGSASDRSDATPWDVDFSPTCIYLL